MGKKTGKVRAAEKFVGQTVALDGSLAFPASRVMVVGVRGTIKGGVACALGPRTLLVGRNAGGKSAVINAIEWALSGVVSDHHGRALVAKESDLLDLGMGSVLFAEVALSDGTRQSTLVSNEKGGRRASIPTSSPAVTGLSLPMRDVRRAFLGSGDAGRRFLLEATCGAVSLPDVWTRVTDSDKDLVEALTTLGLPTDGDLSGVKLVDRLMGVLEAARRNLREAQEEARAAEKLTTLSAAGLAPEPTADFVEGVRRRLSEAESRLVAVGMRDPEAPARLQQIIAEGQVLTDEAQGLRADVAGRGQQTALAALGALLRYCAEHPPAACPLCSGSFPIDYRTRLDQVNALVVKGERLQAIEARLEGLRILYRELHDRIERSAGVPAELTRETVQAEIDAARSTLEQVMALRAQWAQVRKAKSVGASGGRGETWKKVVKALTGAVGSIVDTTRVEFCQRIGAYLPVGDHLVFEDQGGQVRYGLLRADEGRVDTALSAVEEIRVLLAISAAICEGAPPDSLRVLIPEDRAFDPETLGGVMQVLLAAPGQVILAHPTMPDRVPTGWTVVDVDRREHRAKEGEWGFLPLEGKVAEAS